MNPLRFRALVLSHHTQRQAQAFFSTQDAAEAWMRAVLKGVKDQEAVGSVFETVETEVVRVEKGELNELV